MLYVYFSVLFYFFPSVYNIFVFISFKMLISVPIFIPPYGELSQITVTYHCYIFALSQQLACHLVRNTSFSHTTVVNTQMSFLQTVTNCFHCSFFSDFYRISIFCTHAILAFFILSRDHIISTPPPYFINTQLDPFPNTNHSFALYFSGPFLTPRTRGLPRSEDSVWTLV